MPLLTIKLSSEDRSFEFKVGKSIREILDETNIRVRAHCRGFGACGLCKVQVVKGNVSVPTENEIIHLSPHQITEGIRLACQTHPTTNVTIVNLSPASSSNWRNIPNLPKLHSPTFSLSLKKLKKSEQQNQYGIAVDLGTSNIKLTLVDLSNYQRIIGRTCSNPQIKYGEDIISRLIAADSSPTIATDMENKIIQCLTAGLYEINSHEGIDPQKITNLYIVGNTAMLTLLSQNNFSKLLQPQYWTQPFNCYLKSEDLWRHKLGISPSAHISLIQPLAGFVGSDLLAGLLATQFLDSEKIKLFIDFGTNSEIALWDGEELWVTSAAGGPAFEGSGLSCGMPAISGAIYKYSFKIPSDNSKSERHFQVIDGIEPQGICGTGLIDILGHLVQQKMLTNKGNFTQPSFKTGFPIIPGNPDLYLTKKDVDIFQRAKAAIGAGIEILIKKANLDYKDVELICIGGTFGNYLNIEHAQTLGLLPNIGIHRVQLGGNTALIGCEMLMLSQTMQEALKEIKERTKLFNMAEEPQYEDLFLNHLYLKSFGGI